MTSKTEDYFCIRCIITHPSAKVASISNGMGCQPDHSGQQGEAIVTPIGRVLNSIYFETVWSKRYNFPGQKNFVIYISMLIDDFELKTAFFDSIIDSGGSVILAIDFLGCNNVGDEFDPKLLMRMAQIGIGLSIEVFP